MGAKGQLESTVGRRAVPSERGAPLRLSVSLFLSSLWESDRINPPLIFVASRIATRRGAELITGPREELLRAALTTSVYCEDSAPLCRRLLEMGLTAAIIIIPPR